MCWGKLLGMMQGMIQGNVNDLITRAYTAVRWIMSKALGVIVLHDFVLSAKFLSSLAQWAAFEDQYGIYLVSEFASKGDVFADVEKRGGQMTEADTVRQVIHPFLLALIYLHDRNIMHR